MKTQRSTMNGKPVFTVPARTIVNFQSGFGHKLLCDDLTFTTGSACAYSCSFCYVEAMQKKQQAWFAEHGVEYPAEGHAGVVIRNENPVEIARRQILSKPEAFRAATKVIYSSPKVDVAANMELVRETVEMCKLILTETEWEIRLLSKSNLLPKIAQALEAFEPEMPHNAIGRIIYGVSTGTLDNQIAQAFEQGCPLVSKRIESLHWLQDNGFRTFGMVCPSLPQWLPGQSTAAAYLEFARAMAGALRYDHLEHVWAEVINLRGDSFTKTIAALAQGGYGAMADELQRVTADKAEWERYARATFTGHAQVCPPEKLRFLQYVTKDTAAWWTQPGVVKLGPKNPQSPVINPQS